MELDTLEPRVLFSGAPVENTPEPEQTSEAAAHEAQSPEAAASNQQGLVADSTGLDQDAAVSLVGTDALTTQLNQQTLAAIAEVAAQRWEAQGITGDQLAALQKVTYRIADLDGNRLGVAGGASITIDSDAEGRGWFVDGTPDDDAEFSGSGTSLSAAGGAAGAGYDLLTSVMHEQGHMLGLLDEYHNADNLMYGYIQAGQRRLALLGQADGAVAGSLSGDNYLTGTYVWTNGGGDGKLSNAANWLGGIAPVENNDLIFTSATSGALFNDFAPGTRFNTIQFTGHDYTLSGNALELSGGLTANHLAGTIDIQVEITLVNAQTHHERQRGGGVILFRHRQNSHGGIDGHHHDHTDQSRWNVRSHV